MEEYMKKYNVIVILDKDMKNTLMCKRTKEPYMGMYNLVGGKIEKDNDGINEAYRELIEETNISKEDTNLINFMNIEYVSMNKVLEVYFGILNKEVELIEEVNKLEWVSIEDNFFDMKKYAGEGNIGHIIEKIKIYLNSRK
jgi:hydrolase, NUDIX family